MTLGTRTGGLKWVITVMAFNFNSLFDSHLHCDQIPMGEITIGQIIISTPRQCSNVATFIRPSRCDFLKGHRHPASNFSNVIALRAKPFIIWGGGGSGIIERKKIYSPSSEKKKKKLTGRLPRKKIILFKSQKKFAAFPSRKKKLPSSCRGIKIDQHVGQEKQTHQPVGQGKKL